jgi:hypothetical protein
MLSPICVPCQRFFKKEVTGFYFTEMMTSDAPYKIWASDLWRCPGCEATILSGFGSGPIAEHWESTFQDTVKRLHADQLQVNS